MKEPQAAAAIVAAYEHEAYAPVRLAALTTLASMPPHRATLDWALAQLSSLEPRQIPVGLVEILAPRAGSNADIAQALRGLLESGKAPRAVRKVIYTHTLN